MIRGAPDEARWLRAKPRRSVPLNVLQKIVETAFKGCTVVDVQPFTDGFRNANFRIRLDSTPEFMVLRIYEHDASVCRKEVDLLNFIRQSVPVPEIIHAEAGGLDGVPPFVLLSYIEGIAFSELKRSGDANSIAQAAYDAGRILALIGRTTFPKSGWLGPGLCVRAPL